MNAFESTALRMDDKGLWILDQTQLPHKEVWLESHDPRAMVQIIRDLRVRGAPLIGVAAALQLGLLVEKGASAQEFETSLSELRQARPTAVNLMNALDRLRLIAREKGLQYVPAEAERIFHEDIELCMRMAKHGAALIGENETILTHCNTGGLATAGLGTALGCVIQAHREGRRPHVIVDETRPLLQGGRLTTWELAKNEIPFTLICDNMAGFFMQRRKIDRVMVGADRIARNGDFANKVGTYSLAVLCKHHNIPFYVVAPQTTVDPECPNGNEIPIEERAGHEVRGGWSREECEVWNPAFDVTPADLVTGWVMDRGVFSQEQVREGILIH